MKPRQIQILTLLLNNTLNQWVKGGELAEQLHVSSRTIRSDINAINDQLGVVVQSNTHKGYLLSKEDSHVVRDFLRYTKMKTYSDVPEGPEERLVWLMRHLLLSKTGIELEQLANRLYISDATIEQDIIRLKKQIERYQGLMIHKRQGYLILEGLEYSKRKLYIDLLTNEIQDEFMNLDRLALLYPNFNMIMITTMFEEVSQKYHFKPRQSSLPILLLHIGISLDRILAGYEIDYDISEVIQKNQVEYLVSSEFYQRVGKVLVKDISECEVKILARLLTAYQETSPQQVMHTGKSLSATTKKIVAKLSDVVKIDFVSDEEFLYGLEMHLLGLIERVEHGLYIPNVLLNDTKHRYPLIFDMAVFVANELSKELDCPITEEEIGFIAIHFGASYARISNQKSIKTIIIGNVNSRLMTLVEEKLMCRFKERIVIVDVIALYEESMMIEKNIDLIISLYPISHRLPIETIQISPFLNGDDEVRIFKALNTIEKRKMELDFMIQMNHLINEEFYYESIIAQTPTQVISHMVQALEEQQIVTEDYLSSVLKRENISPTSFEFGIAIPHPLVLKSRKSVISIAQLEEPIQWGNYQVQLVIMLAINEKDRAFMTIFFDWLSEIISNPKSIKKLITAKNRQEFIQYIINHS